MHKYVALWHGGPSYSESNWATDAFFVSTTEEAGDILRATYYGRMPRAVAVEWDDITGQPRKGATLDTVGTPCATEPYMYLARVRPGDMLSALECDGPYACDYLVTLSLTRRNPRVMKF